MVEVTFLGTGGAFASGRRTNVALLVEAPDFRLLVETGPTIVHQLARVNRRAVDINWLFVSHLHGDHSLGFPMLALNRVDAPTPLHVYAGHTTVRTLKELWRIVYPGLDDRRLNLQYHELSEVEQEQVVLQEGVTMTTSLVPSPPGVPTLAARWELDGLVIVFATDTVPNDTVVELAHGADLLIHEASFSAVLQPGYEPNAHFHTTAQQAGEIARRAECRIVALIHLNPLASRHPDVLVEEARGDTDLRVIVPEDGERIRCEGGSCVADEKGPVIENPRGERK